LKQSVIIVAGGKGSRMGTETPKQFLPLVGKPIILHTIDRFRETLPEADIILVLPKAEKARWQVMAYDTKYQNISIAEGGANRFDSVKSGLELVEEGVVGIHDSVRPLVSKSCIKAAFEMAEKNGAAVPVIELKDSIRKIEGQASKALDRKEFCLVQTPQCFQVDKLKKAYQTEFKPHFTDDASVFEASDFKINLVAGNSENIKITTPEDLVIAEALLKLV
jgi:2-C-methyl-D-erythritol 4-phosphate cytidylyltransferase